MASKKMSDFETKTRLFQTLLRGWGVDLTPRRLLPCGVYSLTSKACPGDHIAVRSVVNGTRDVIWHHGVYMGDEHVVHMHPDGNISQVPIDKFMAGLPTATTYVESAGVVQYDGDTDAARTNTMMAARYAIQDPEMQSLVYNIVEHQCDGFAVWCRMGRWAHSEICHLLANAQLHRPPQIYTPCGKF